MKDEVPSQGAEEYASNVRLSNDMLKDWLRDAYEDFDYFSGRQWTESDIAAMEEIGKPAVTFNRVVRTINAVAGIEVQNRHEASFIPREINDTESADLMTKAVNYVRDNCDAEDEESESLRDTLVCGMGWTETRVDYEVDPEGQIIIDNIDPLEMRWDPAARKRNLDDRRWQCRLKRMSKGEFREQFPDVDISTIDYGDWLNSGPKKPYDATNSWRYADDQSAFTYDQQKPIIVAQYQYYVREKRYCIKRGMNGGPIELTEGKFRVISKAYDEARDDVLEAAGIDPNDFDYFTCMRRKYKQVFFIGNTILDEEDIAIDNFTFNCITGLRNRNDNYWFGLVSLMKDPQRWANKWLSQIQYILSANSNGGLLVEEDAVDDPRALERTWSDPRDITYVNPGALAQGKIQQKQVADFPAGVDRLLQYAISAINEVPGVNLEMLGMADRNQAGVLEFERKLTAMTNQTVFFDSLRRYRKEQGRVLAAMVREYLTDGRIIRITGDMGDAQYVRLMRDRLSFSYDITVDESPMSPNMKERVYGVLANSLPILLQAGIPIPLEIIDYMPIPEILKNKWKQKIHEDMNTPPSPEEQKEKAMNMARKELQLQKDQMDIQEKQSQSDLNSARAFKERVTAAEETDATEKELQADLVKMNQQAQIDVDKTLIDQQRKNLDDLLQDTRKQYQSMASPKGNAQEEMNNNNRSENKVTYDPRTNK